MMPSWARSRPTETRLKAILNLSFINLATISRVHSAKANFICSGFLCVTASKIHPQRPPIQFRRTPEQRLRLQGAPAAAPVLRQPSVNRRPVQPKNAGYRFWAFALLDLTHRAFAQCFQRLVTQSPCIVFSHTGGKSLNTRTVNKKSTYL